MKVKFSDIDIIISVKLYEVMKYFKVVFIGIKYGMIIIMYDNVFFEVIIFRIDGFIFDFRYLDFVIYLDNVNDDVMCCDFIMNGILMDEY